MKIRVSFWVEEQEQSANKVMTVINREKCFMNFIF